MKEDFKLSESAIGAIMMILQKAILLQGNAVEELKNLNFEVLGGTHLMVTNPPTFEYNKDTLANLVEKERKN